MPPLKTCHVPLVDVDIDSDLFSLSWGHLVLHSQESNTSRTLLGICKPDTILLSSNSLRLQLLKITDC